MAAAAEAKKRNWKMAIAVVGPAGQLVAHATIDGTQYASIEIAQAKARTAALLRRQTKLLADAINGGTPATLSLLALTHGVASEGGFPIVVDGKLIGAIGASGGTAPQDGVVAKAAWTRSPRTERRMACIRGLMGSLRSTSKTLANCRMG